MYLTTPPNRSLPQAWSFHSPTGQLQRGRWFRDAELQIFLLRKFKNIRQRREIGMVGWDGWEAFRPLRGFFSLRFNQTEEAPERAKLLSTIPISRLCLIFWNKFFLFWTFISLRNFTDTIDYLPCSHLIPEYPVEQRHIYPIPAGRLTQVPSFMHGALLHVVCPGQERKEVDKHSPLTVRVISFLSPGAAAREFSWHLPFGHTKKNFLFPVAKVEEGMVGRSVHNFSWTLTRSLPRAILTFHHPGGQHLW